MLAGCRHSSDKPRALLASQAPLVATAKALVGPGVAPPPVLVIVAPDGSISVADVPGVPAPGEPWAGLNQPPTRAPVPVDRRVIADLLREVRAPGVAIEPLAARLAAGGAAPAPVPADAAADDPPPPEEEPIDDGADESGGTGTWVTLEEGKMGKKVPERPAPQYDDPQLGAAIRAARRAGLLGPARTAAERALDPAAVDNDGPDVPVRAAALVGAAYDTHARPARALVIAAPTAKAAAVIELLAAIDGAALGVAHEGRLRALRIGFGVLSERAPGSAVPQPWVEVRVGAREVTVEVVPSPAITIPFSAAGALDPVALGKAYDTARGSLADRDRRDVDVLVGADTDAQRLVDVIAALDGAGALIVALGAMPPAAELAKRGRPIPRVLIGQPQVQGAMDKPSIRARVRAELPAIKACYERALATKPTLTGTVQAQFFISPNGVVAASSASGVDPEVATCVADLIKALEFGKPSGGGGAQVNYPFTFRN